MSTNVNWGKLVQEGRVKAPGVPWSEEEQKAISNGMKFQDVRAGILSKEDLEEAQKSGRLYHRMGDAELAERARELGVREFAEGEVTRDWLLTEIENAENRSNKKSKKQLPKASEASGSDEEGESGDEDNGEGEQSEEEAPDLDSMKKDELVEHAKSLGIEVTEEDTKATLKEKIAAQAK